MKNNLFTLLIFILLFIFFNNTLTGQRRGLVSRQASSIDIIIGGDLGVSLIGGDGSQKEIQDIIDRRKTPEDFRLSTRFGINYNHGIGERFSLKTGIRFANPGFSISSVEEINPEQDINTIEKNFISNGFQYQYKYQMIELPLGLKFLLGGGFCNPYLEFGVATNFYRRTMVEKKLYKADGNELISKNSIYINEAINKTNFIGFISTGGDFAIARNIHGFSQLVIRYQFNNLRPESLITEKLLSIGMELGVRYYLRN